VIVAVQSGTITSWDHECNTVDYAAGTVFIESGDDAAQIGNLTGTDAVLAATFIVPGTTSAVFRVEADQPSCDQG
jgi:hypothetical protein